MGDNPTAGGAGDVTWTLDKLLKIKEFKSENGPELIYASIPGPDLILNALKLKLEIKLVVMLELKLMIDFHHLFFKWNFKNPFRR